MEPHPRLTQPYRYLPPHVHEVMLAAARGGFTAFVWRAGEGGAMATIPLMGCAPDCEPWLREALEEDHGFSALEAEMVARWLFGELRYAAARGQRAG